MTWNEIVDAINAGGTGTYKITHKNGNSETRRLFVSSGGEACEFKKGSSKRGYSLGYTLNSNDVLSITRIKSKDRNERSYEAFTKNLIKLTKYLSVSGMWKHVWDSATILLSMSDKHRRELYDRLQSENRPAGQSWSDWYDGMEKLCKEKKISLSIDELHSLCRHSGIKTVNYESINGFMPIKELVKQAIADAKAGKTTENNWSDKVTFHAAYSWRKKYDISLTIDNRTDLGLVGHYSEEYKNCGNGHYYILLDESHVMFVEND